MPYRSKFLTPDSMPSLPRQATSLALTLSAFLSSCGGGVGTAAAPPAALRELGEAKVQWMAVRAAIPDSVLLPGKSIEASLWIGCNAADPNPKVLRAWIGSDQTADHAKSVARLAPPSMRHHFLATIAVPDPIPTDARFQIEIEDTSGVLHRVGFELNP
jgi:hypothetical protein